MSKYVHHICFLLIIATLLLGCGVENDNYIILPDYDINNQVKVTVSGFVTDGTNTSNKTSELRYNLNNDLSGILVYIEGHKELSDITDSNGRFIINRVPAGIRSFIAEKKEMGVIAYRQRLESINIKASKEIFELTTPISIVASPYSNTLVIKDPTTDKPVPFAKATIWDTVYTSDNNGTLSITNFPAIENTNLIISASGYRPFTTKISFGENLKATSEIKMSRTEDNNTYPAVSIKYKETSAIYQNQDKLVLEPNTYIDLEAIGYSQNDSTTALTWNWSATEGKFNGNTSNKTIMYMAPENCNKVTITITGENSLRAKGKATLEFLVNSGKPQEDEPVNQPPYPITNISPANNAKNISVAQPFTFKWNCLGDPDSDDTVTYSVYLKKNDSDFISIGNTTDQQLIYSDTISDNTEYSWYVTATDKSGLSSKGETWNFRTESLDGITVTTPTTVTTPLKLQFAKTVDITKTELSTVAVFIPPVAGSWKWTDNNKTAEFMPNNGCWYPGSYNAIMIEPEKIIFSDGKKNVNDFYKQFELTSDIPIPEGYRSFAFPMKFKANEASACKIPLLKKGKNAYALIINDSEEIHKGYIADNSISFNNIKNDPTYQYRVQEIELQNKRLPDIVRFGRNSSARAALKSHELYEKRNFIVDTGNGNKVVTTLLVAYNDKALIYADINIQPTENNIKRINTLLDKFSLNGGMLETNEQYFGQAPQCGPDGEDRLAMVLYNPAPNSSKCGYFAPRDLYDIDMNNPALCTSNACKAVYLNFTLEDYLLYSTLAHEFQHLIYFYHKGMGKFEDNNYLLTQEDIWLNEGMSKIAEEINGYDINNNPDTASWIKSSQKDIDRLSLTNWDGETYGIAYLFMRYLTQPNRYKATVKDITRAIIASGRQESTKDIEKITGEPFKTTLAKWALSLYINDWNSTNPQAYGIHGLNLKGYYSGRKLDGFPIYNISVGQVIGPFRMPKNGFACVRAPSAGDFSITAIAFISEQPTTVYFFDERDY